MRLASRGVIPVSGAVLSYAVEGRGTPLVILHGGPGLGCSYLQDDLTRLLAGSYQLLFYDQRGSGRSSGLEDVSRLRMACFVEDLETVRQAAGLEQMHLLGHSFGGLLAMYYAVAYPQHLRSMILLDSDPASWQHWIPHLAVIEARRTEEERRQMEAIRKSPDWESNPELAARYFRVLLRPYFANPDLAQRLELTLDSQALAKLSATSRAMREDLGQFDLLDQLQGITSPTLVLCGDSSIFPLAGAEAIHSRLPNSRLVILEDVGHFPHIEAPLRFVTAVRDFLPVDP